MATSTPAPILPDPTRLHLTQLQATPGQITAIVTTTSSEAACPLCQCRSTHVHSRYVRLIADLPWMEWAVRLELHTRRFFCSNLACSRQIFTERLPDVVEPYARRTKRLEAVLTLIGFALGGQAGKRLVEGMGLDLSPDTLLRLIHRAPESAHPTPRVLSVDDFSFLRGKVFGTILVDLERRVPIELLPDREAATLAQWLRDHPGVEIISRDRGVNYAEGAKQGAPHAVQVADRFHIVKNLGEALEDLLARHLSASRKQQVEAALEEQAPDWREMAEAKLADKLKKGPSAYQQDRLALYQQAIQLRDQGMTQFAIAQQIRVSLRTIQRWLAAPTCPERTGSHYRSHLDPYFPFIRQRWEQGCHNIAQLYRELGAQGFKGSYASVRQTLVRWLQSDGRKPPKQLSSQLPALATSKQAAVLFLRRPENLRGEEQQTLAKLLQLHPEVHLAYELVQQFAQMVRQRQGHLLDGWLETVLQSSLTDLHPFVRGMYQDKAAVQAGLTLEWNQGQTEGQVTRLKLIKRQGYGRAGFQTLRKRVLHRA